MQKRLLNGAARPLNVETLNYGLVHEPPLPANVLVRLGALLLVALCFGLTAHLLVGAS